MSKKNDSRIVKDKREKDDVIVRDRRRNPRVAEEVEVDFEVSMEGPHNFFNGFTQDISRGGVFLATHQIYPIGTEIKMSFTIENRRIDVETVVKWVKNPENTAEDDSPGMGLQFRNLDGDDKTFIDNFIKKKEPMFMDVD